MSFAQDLFCFAVLLTIMVAAVLSIATSIGGCWWPITARAVLVDVAFWKFSNNSPNFSSVADAIKCFIMLNSTCTGPFSGGIYCIGGSDFGPRKKDPTDLLHASGSNM